MAKFHSEEYMFILLKRGTNLMAPPTLMPSSFAISLQLDKILQTMSSLSRAKGQSLSNSSNSLGYFKSNSDVCQFRSNLLISSILNHINPS